MTITGDGRKWSVLSDPRLNILGLAPLNSAKKTESQNGHVIISGEISEQEIPGGHIAKG
jgi:hypothetical protein